jgi:hypothetical protein
MFEILHLGIITWFEAPIFDEQMTGSVPGNAKDSWSALRQKQD